MNTQQLTILGLAALSFDLHAKLAKEYGGAEKWGYRTVDTLVSCLERHGVRSS